VNAHSIHSIFFNGICSPVNYTSGHPLAFSIYFQKMCISFTMTTLFYNCRVSLTTGTSFSTLRIVSDSQFTSMPLTCDIAQADVAVIDGRLDCNSISTLLTDDVTVVGSSGTHSITVSNTMVKLSLEGVEIAGSSPIVVQGHSDVTLLSRGVNLIRATTPDRARVACSGDSRITFTASDGGSLSVSGGENAVANAAISTIPSHSVVRWYIASTHFETLFRLWDRIFGFEAKVKSSPPT
jgi:hypothetical protein